VSIDAAGETEEIARQKLEAAKKEVSELLIPVLDLEKDELKKKQLAELHKEEDHHDDHVPPPPPPKQPTATTALEALLAGQPPMSAPPAVPLYAAASNNNGAAYVPSVSTVGYNTLSNAPQPPQSYGWNTSYHNANQY
jgi:hypothetical protein